MKLTVIGFGQCGGRIADEFARLNGRARGLRGLDIISGAYAVNTDLADLSGLHTIRSDHEHRIVIGQMLDNIVANAIADSLSVLIPTTQDRRLPPRAGIGGRLRGEQNHRRVGRKVRHEVDRNSDVAQVVLQEVLPARLEWLVAGDADGMAEPAEKFVRLFQ